MELFGFPYHKVRSRYPKNATEIQFGRSWAFTARPESIYQREFTLRMRGLKYFVDSAGKVNPLAQPLALNLGAFEAFYQRHETWNPFTYDHPALGRMTCRFKEPLDLPDGIDGGDGQVEEFEVTFIEMPGVASLPGGPSLPGGDTGTPPPDPPPPTGNPPAFGLVTDDGDFLVNHLGVYLEWVDAFGGGGVPVESFITDDGDNLVTDDGDYLVFS